MNSNNSSQESGEIQEAIEFLQSGKLDLAEKYLQLLVGRNSNNAEAVHLLGLIKFQKKDFLKAYDLISQSINLNSKNPIFYSNRGEVLREMGQLDDSINDHNMSILLDSSKPTAYLNRALVYHQKLCHELAKNDYLKAADLDSQNYLVYYYLGNLYAEIENYEEAVVTYLKSLKIKPDNWLAWANLGHVYEKKHRLNDALECYKKSISINPTCSITYSNLANVYEYLRRYDDAIMACESAIKLDPNFAAPYSNLANALSAKKKFKEAVVYYNKAIDLNPNFTQAFFNCSNAFLELNELDSAIKYLDSAAKISPCNADIFYNRGNIHSKLDINLGLKDFEKVVELKPDTEIVYGNLFLGYLRTCEWGQFERVKKIIIEKLNRHELCANPLQLASAFNSLHFLKASAEIYTQKYFQPKKRKLINHQHNNKIKIGYFSEDFRKHPVAYLLLEVLVSHDRDKFEIHAFSLSKSRPDEYADLIAGAVDYFHDFSSRTDEYILEFVRQQSIDIAIDLGVFTSMRLTLFAEQLAPVQVNFLGYAGTSGTSFIDYIIADPFTIPANSEIFYSEKIIRLPCFMPRDSRVLPNVKRFLRSDFNLPEDSFIFVCTSGYGKITPEIFKIWMNILKSVPGSYLWLGESKDSGVTEKLKNHAVSMGVQKERLIFFKFLDSPTDYLSRLQLADLFLDTFPYGAHTTANDALWADLPVLTCAGETFASRVAASFLTKIRLDELVTESLSEYECKAIELGKNRLALKEIRQKLIQNKITSGVFNMKLYTVYLEQAFLEMYNLSISGKQIENISIKSL